MSNPVDREGVFRAVISGFGVQNADSGALGVALTFDMTEIWCPPVDGNDGYWHPWSEYNQQVQGTWWIVKKDSTPNNGAIEQLCRYAGWGGTLAPIAEGTWEPTPVQVTVKNEVRKQDGKPDRSELRACFLNDFNRVPGAQGNVDAAKAQELDARFGGHFRAIAGTVAQSKTTPAAGKPSAPARPAPPAGPKPTGVPAGQAKAARDAAAANGEDGVPF